MAPSFVMRCVAFTARFAMSWLQNTSETKSTPSSLKSPEWLVWAEGCQLARVMLAVLHGPQSRGEKTLGRIDESREGISDHACLLRELERFPTSQLHWT